MQQHGQDPIVNNYSQQTYQSYYNLIAPGTHNFPDAGSGTDPLVIGNWWRAITGNALLSTPSPLSGLENHLAGDVLKPRWY